MKKNEKMKLIIGNKNYSTWSLRAWLALHAFDIDFEEIQIELFSESAKVILDKFSPTAKVPVLIDLSCSHEPPVIWDSLAISMHLADTTAVPLWGNHAAVARSLVSEMHSSFLAIRTEMPMNIRASRKILPSQACLNDIKRIDSLFSTYRKQYAHEGHYLLGKFSLADVFFAPLVFRFKTYNDYSGIRLSPLSQKYLETMLIHPSMVEWRREALKETTVIEHDEVGSDSKPC